MPTRIEPKSATPTRSADKTSPTCTKKSKKGRHVDSPNIVVRTQYVDTPQMDVLRATSNQAFGSWKDGDGWALLGSKSFFSSAHQQYSKIPYSLHGGHSDMCTYVFYPQAGIIPVSEHYQMIAGYVTITSRTVDDVLNSCGEVVRRTVIKNRHWVANLYDIGHQGSLLLWTTRKEGIDWVQGYNDRANEWGPVTFSSLGKIKAGWSYADISTKGQIYAKEHPLYLWVPVPPGNNCKTFAQAFYQQLK